MVSIRVFPDRVPGFCELETGMITKDVSIPDAPFEIERVWIDDRRLFYTRRGDSLVYSGPDRTGVKALLAALQEILKALR